MGTGAERISPRLATRLDDVLERRSQLNCAQTSLIRGANLRLQICLILARMHNMCEAERELDSSWMGQCEITLSRLIVISRGGVVYLHFTYFIHYYHYYFRLVIWSSKPSRGLSVGGWCSLTGWRAITLMWLSRCQVLGSLASKSNIS